MHRANTQSKETKIQKNWENPIFFLSITIMITLSPRDSEIECKAFLMKIIIRKRETVKGLRKKLTYKWVTGRNSISLSCFF